MRRLAHGGDFHFMGE
jgi:hypothetical protein